MGRLKRGLKVAVRLFLGAASVTLLAAGGWWLTRPPADRGVPELHQELLTHAGDRAVADSALSLARQLADDLDLPSVSFAVSIQGETVWAAALGKADVGQNHDASLNTVYRAGSVSKSMTGLAVARLVERGGLDLDAPAGTYLPEFPEKRWPITPRQLGAHTGGVRHYASPAEPGFFSEQFSKRRYGSVGEALSLFEEDPLLFEPGTAFQYSTHGFTLLGAVAEAASGVPFLELLDQEVWAPLGMGRTRPDDLSGPDRAVPYTALGGRLFHTEGANPSYKWAGGGILSTPSDLVEMGAGLMAGDVIGDSLRAELFRPLPLADGSPNPQAYALGWRNGRESRLLGTPDTVAVLLHGGASPGGSSFLLLVPEWRGAAAGMTNMTLRDPRPLRRAVYEIMGMFRSSPRMERSSGGM
jgi:CubicO group peptidase (beta-lactamase class C family)